VAVVVEDGTGKPDANTLIAAVDVTTFWADRGTNATWTGLSNAEKDARVVLATDYLLTNPRYKRIRGQRKTQTQRLMWPRIDCVERDGQAVPDNIVPQAWKDAVALLAPLATSLPTLLPDLTRGGRIKSESLTGVGSRTFMDDAPVGTVIQYVDGLLLPFLIEAGEFDMSSYSGAQAVAGVAPLPVVFDSEYFASGAADDASATE
jgi:hypothetical protein